MSDARPVYVPETVGELLDMLGFMMIKSPQFRDAAFPNRNMESVFFQLNEGLKHVRPELGDVLYAKMLDMSVRMRAYFEADPEDKTEDGLAGRGLIDQMEGILLEIESRQQG